MGDRFQKEKNGLKKMEGVSYPVMRMRSISECESVYLDIVDLHRKPAQHIL